MRAVQSRRPAYALPPPGKSQTYLTHCCGGVPKNQNTFEAKCSYGGKCSYGAKCSYEAKCFFCTYFSFSAFPMDFLSTPHMAVAERLNTIMVYFAFIIGKEGLTPPCSLFIMPRATE
ncbi:uncharacterized protein TM35_000931110 [Trypanosoma theileri]|uniref:Uncharacterized protein n=1 Tax=Trypanosoma theileri TaxID=67003 RepID=A0A1X0NEU5_9TRYP|nr:uncharacterized protein TM35_000931110 [Trypanosoma theileri]ORC82353.1 hypothetical protein TM35_000931110 [Trypanosoma theileri]